MQDLELIYPNLAKDQKIIEQEFLLYLKINIFFWTPVRILVGTIFVGSNCVVYYRYYIAKKP